MTARACVGRSANPDGCRAPARYAVERPAGPGKVRVGHACGRHLAWVLDYMTVPGARVTVERLAPESTP